MFGPVRRIKLASFGPPMVMSLGTKEPLPKESLLRTGCPKLLAYRYGASFVHNVRAKLGLHVGPSL